VRGVLESGRVHKREGQIADAPRAFAAVAGHARRIVHDRELAAHKPVEQCGLADIGAPDNGDCDAHLRVSLTSALPACAGSRLTAPPAPRVLRPALRPLQPRAYRGPGLPARARPEARRLRRWSRTRGIRDRPAPCPAGPGWPRLRTPGSRSSRAR